MTSADLCSDAQRNVRGNDMEKTARRSAMLLVAAMIVVLAGCPPQPAAWDCDSVISGQTRSAGFLPNTSDFELCDFGPETGRPDGRNSSITGWLERTTDPSSTTLVIERRDYEYSTLMFRSQDRFAFNPAPDGGSIPLGEYQLAVPGDQTTAYMMTTGDDDGAPPTYPSWADNGGVVRGFITIEAIEIGDFDANNKAPIKHLKSQHYLIRPDNFTEWTSARVRIGSPGN